MRGRRWHAHALNSRHQGIASPSRSRTQDFNGHWRSHRAAARCRRRDDARSDLAARPRWNVGAAGRDPRRADDMTEVAITTRSHQLKGYLAKPQGEGPWPAVIVLHDIFG